MSCEKYKSALIAAAITGRDATGADLTGPHATGEVSPAVRAHAEVCPSCAAELAQQRSLLAAIDANLHRQMNAPVPPAMLQRFEARLAQEPQLHPSRSPRFPWLYTAAAFATAAALILFALSHHHAHKSNSPIATLAQTKKSTSDHRPQITTAILQPASPQEIRRDKEQHRRTAAHTVSASTTPTRTEPEVLVPPDERIALEHFIANLDARREVVAAFVKPLREKPELPVKHIEIPDIKTAALVIAPITEETRR